MSYFVRVKPLAVFFTIIQIGMIAASFICLYVNTFAMLIADWKTDDDFSHGFLIPIISGYLIWINRAKLTAVRIQPSSWGIAVICFALILYVAGILGAELFIQRSSMIVCLMGISLYLFGWKITKQVSFPLVYLFFMIPIPAIIWNQIAFPMQLMAAKLSASVIQLLGIAVLREGNILHLSNTSLEVVNACSGLRSLTALLALSAAFAYLSNLKLLSKWILFLSAAPIAIIVNIVRLTFTSILVDSYGSGILSGLVHELTGVMIFGIALISLWGCYQALSSIEKRQTTA